MKKTLNFRNIFFVARRTALGKAIFCALLLAAVVSACRDVGLDKESPSEEPFTEGVMRVGYEMETLTYVKTDAPDEKLTAVDKVEAEPSVRRTFNQLTIFEDGSSEQEVRTLTPKNRQFESRDKTMPDTTLKIVKSKVDRDGTAHLYDATGVEKHARKLEKLPNYKDWVSYLNTPDKKDEVRRRLQGIDGPKDIKVLLENAKNTGAVVRELSDGGFVVIQKMPAVPNSLKENSEEQTVESFVNVHHGVLVAQRVYNDQNRLVTKTIHQYDIVANAAPKLTKTRQETFKLNAQGHETTEVLITQYDNMSIQIR